MRHLTAGRLEDFDKGISQISTIAPTSFKQMIDGYHIAADLYMSLPSFQLHYN